MDPLIATIPWCLNNTCRRHNKGQFPSLFTHPPRDKMTAILTDDIFNCIFLNENYKIRIQISIKYIPRSPIDNTLVASPALIQVMTWRRAGDKPLSETMTPQFRDAYMWH